MVAKGEVQRCYAELQPLIMEIVRASKTAQLDAGGRAGLALLLATAMFGNACAAIDEMDGKPGAEFSIETARKTTDLLLAIFERGEAQLSA